MSKNRYTRALKHLKNKTIDEKLELLTELPTNHTTGLYVDVPGSEVIPPPVPGPIDAAANYSQDGDGAPGYTGTDTTGLFMTDGTIKTVEPPGDTSYILGPMSSMWYAWANYTQIGYIRQEDRKMVNLGRITGELDDWDGVSGFTAYGQLTLEQAVWFKNITRVNDYRAFYPGPPSSVKDEYGRYICSITGESKPTERQPPNYFAPGSQKGGNPDDNVALQIAQRQAQSDAEEEQRRADERNRLLLNALMLGLDIAAVIGLLFPEPASSAAGAARLASKLRYLSKLRMKRGALNPFGQRAVRSGAAGRQRVNVYSGRPYKGKRGFGDTTYGTTDPRTAATYSNPGPLKGTPGTGSRVNPRGTVDKGTLPQRYIDKYGSRSVLGQRQVKLGRKAAKRTFGEELELLKLLRESAPTGTGAGGGVDIADTYVDEVSQKASPEELEQASNDANEIAIQGGLGASQSDIDKTDREAEKEAKRQTNIDINNPESMTSEQLYNSFDMMYEADPDLLSDLVDEYENLIDKETADAAWEEYSERKSYLYSDDFAKSYSSEYSQLYDRTEYLWTNFMSRVDSVPDSESALGFRWVIDGGNPLTPEQYDTLMEWGSGMSRRGELQSSVILPEVRRQIELAEQKYANLIESAFREFYIAIINAWNEPEFTDEELAEIDGLGGLLAAALALGFVFTSIKSFIDWFNNQSPEFQQELRDLMDTQAKTNDTFGTSDAATLATLSGDQEKKKKKGDELAQMLPKTEAEIDAMLLRGLERGDYGTGPQIQKQIDSLRRNQRNNTPGGIPRANKNTSSGTVVAHYEPPKFLNNRARQPITEVGIPNQKRILREIKKPIVIDEGPTKFKVKPTGRKNKSVGSSMMKKVETPVTYKPVNNIWSKKDKVRNIRASQEKKNQVLELVGAAEHHWTYLTEDRRKKKQEKVNEMMSAEFDKSLELMYENYKKSIDGKSEKLVNKIRTKVKPEYPENPPEGINLKTGMHPKYGKKYKHDKLDPHSAESMPPTGDPVIDANAKKAHDPVQKARKIKNLIGKMRQHKIDEAMTTAGLGMVNLDGEGEIDLSTNDVGSSSAYFKTNNATFSGSTATFDFSDSPNVGQTYTRYAYFDPIDATEFDTFKTTVSVGSGPAEWFEPPSYTRGEEEPPTHAFSGGFRVVMYSKSQENSLSTYHSVELSSGTKSINIPDRLRVKDLVVYYIGHANKDPLNGGVTGNYSVSSASFQRKNPINLVVPLDDPEANSFIRGGLGGSEERRKQLKDMLDAGNELMIELGVEPSKTSPGDIELAQAEYPADDWNDEDEALLNWLQQGGIPGTEKDIERLLQRKSEYGG